MQVTIFKNLFLSSYLWALLFFTLLIFTSYPGFVSIDSEGQYNQSISLNFTDGSPPIMSWLWSKFHYISTGYQSMLIFHLSLLWLGILAWNYSAENSSKINIFFFIGLLPWVINFQCVIWKDVGLASCLVLASGLLAKSKNHRLEYLIIFILLIYAFMVRINSLVAVAPLIWFTLYKLCQKPKMSIIYTCGIIILMISFLNIFNYHFLNAKKENMQTYMMIDDLTHLSVVANKSLIPGLNIEIIKKCSSEQIAETKLVGRLFCYTKLDEYKNNKLGIYKNIEKAWLKVVKTYPLEYLKFRFMSFMYLIRSPSNPPYNFFYTTHFKNNNDTGKIQKIFINTLEIYVRATAKITPFFFKPYFWLLISVIFLIATFLIKTNKKNLIFSRVLLISGSLYTLGYIPVTPTADLRYTYWSSIGITLGIINLLYPIIKRRYKVLNF